jgi:hypothetical protein
LVTQTMLPVTQQAVQALSSVTRIVDPVPAPTPEVVPSTTRGDTSVIPNAAPTFPAVPSSPPQPSPFSLVVIANPRGAYGPTAAHKSGAAAAVRQVTPDGGGNDESNSAFARPNAPEPSPPYAPTAPFGPFAPVPASGSLGGGAALGGAHVLVCTDRLLSANPAAWSTRLGVNPSGPGTEHALILIFPA